MQSDKREYRPHLAVCQAWAVARHHTERGELFKHQVHSDPVDLQFVPELT